MEKKVSSNLVFLSQSPLKIVRSLLLSSILPVMSNSHGSAHHLEVDSHSTLEVASHSHPTDASYSYPEVAHESYPEVVSQSVPGDAQHSYPEVVSQYNRDSKYQHTQVPSPGPSPVPAYSKGGYGAPVEIGEHSARDEGRQPPAPPTSIWQRRKWLILGVAAVVLVIAVVAGVVGGVVGSKSANNTASPGSSNSSATPSSDGSSGSSSGSGSGTNTATGGPTSTTNAGSPTSVPTAISNPIPMAAAANTDSAGTVSIAVFYRQSASANLMYTLYTRGYGFTVTNQVALKLPVAAGSPMALTSRLNSQNNQTVLDLFYRYVDDGTTHIVMSEQVCDSGSPVCTESISGILTGNTTQQVHTQSNVAAIWIGQGSITGRVYYQAVDGSIIEANSDGAATAGWVTRTIHTGGVIGTSIAAAVYPSGPQIHVTFVDNTTSNPTDLTYTGSWSGTSNSR